MDGLRAGTFRRAHADSAAKIGSVEISDRRAARGAGGRRARARARRGPGAPGTAPVDEEPDPVRTCFERDRDRILHGTTAFRRLAGKTQVFVFPEDHQRTRLTHALEVAQVATSIARACRLNVALTEAIALGHDCGHGPFGHASEDAFTPYVPGGFDHAVWGADVVLEPVNLCAETLDGIRNHSWSRPGAGHARGRGRLVGRPHRLRLPRLRGRGARRHRHARRCCPAVGAGASAATGGAASSTRSSRRWSRPRCAPARSGWTAPTGRGARRVPRASTTSRSTCGRPRWPRAQAVVRVLHALVEYYADRPNTLPFPELAGSGHRSDSASGGRHGGLEAVTYVAGMTDRFAFTPGRRPSRLGPASLPAGLDVAIGR